jgi:uncharacterized protein (TIGR02444 family)
MLARMGAEQAAARGMWEVRLAATRASRQLPFGAMASILPAGSRPSWSSWPSESFSTTAPRLCGTVDAGEQEEAMSRSGSTDSFSRFALELYRRAGVADACLDLQNRHDLDVNVVLFAAFVGAVQRQTLTTVDLDLAHGRVDAWHQQVVRPLRAVRQRLKTGPAPAPDEASTALRRKLAQLEIEAEMIELDQLGALMPQVRYPRKTSSAAECATAAIETVIRAHTGTALSDQDRQAIDTIAAQTRHIDANR